MAETRIATATIPPASSGAEVLIIVAHPQLEQSRVNRRLMQAAAAAAPGPASRSSLAPIPIPLPIPLPSSSSSPTSAATPARAGIAVRDLYALYPDYLIDVAAEQAALADARLIVWQHPIHWYGMPPLLKLWVDDVFTFGWAYGPSGTALRGKDLWLVATTGGAEDSYRPDRYNRYFFDAFLPPYEQTAALCGLRFLPPLLLHGAHRAGEAEIAGHAAVYAQRLASYPDWPEIADLPACPACEVPLTARPLENFAEVV